LPNPPSASWVAAAARAIGINRAKPITQEFPKNRAGQLRKRVSRVDDLIQPSAQGIMLTVVARFLRSHICPLKTSQKQRTTIGPVEENCQKTL